MFKKPSIKHQNEIAGLAIEHKDALLAYGSDMYNHGLIDGCKYMAIGVVIGQVITSGVEMIIKKHRNNHN